VFFFNKEAASRGFLGMLAEVLEERNTALFMANAVGQEG